MKYLSLTLFCIVLTACNINNEATTEVDASDAIKVNTTDTINFDSNNNTSVEVSNDEALECHNTIPDWQIEELAEVPCLELPISNQKFLNMKKFDNGIFDVKGDTKFLKSQIYDEQINIGLIPYDDEQAFLISFSNSLTEDSYPSQHFYISRIRRDEPQLSIFNLSASPLGIVQYDFQDSELIKLGIDPNEFADIDFNTLGQENIRIDDVCMMNFNIATDWRLTRSYSCQNSKAAKEDVDSFKEQFGFEYRLANTDMGMNYERVD